MTENPQEVIETRTAKIWIADDICHVQIHTGSTVDLEDARTVFEAAARLTGGQLVLVLVDLSEIASATRLAREYGTSPAIKGATKAVGLLVRRPISKIVGNLFINFSRPPYPTRLFTSEAEAIEWLEGFRHET